MTIKLVVKNEKLDAGSAAKTFTFDELLITLGSNPAASVSLTEPNIAHEQAVIINENGQPLFINQNRGTILNGSELDQGLQHNLRTGDSIIIGSYQIIVLLDANHVADAGENAAEPNFNSTPQIEQPAQKLLAAEPELIAAEEIVEDKFDARSFKDILKGLRKEEDQYYFQITDADNAKRRLAIAVDEIVLGWNNEDNLLFSNQIAIIDQPQAVVRKDWSGITIYPNGEEAVLLNDTLLEAGTLLRNGDKVVFSRRFGDNAIQTATLVFCEPAALVELNQILPQELLSNALEVSKSGEIEVEPEPAPETVETPPIESVVKPKPPKVRFANRLILYYYPAEIIIMLAATILLGVLVFLTLSVL